MRVKDSPEVSQDQSGCEKHVTTAPFVLSPLMKTAKPPPRPTGCMSAAIPARRHGRWDERIAAPPHTTLSGMSPAPKEPGFLQKSCYGLWYVANWLLHEYAGMQFRKLKLGGKALKALRVSMFSTMVQFSEQAQAEFDTGRVIAIMETQVCPQPES